jgi:hypothetical protein
MYPGAARRREISENLAAPKYRAYIHREAGKLRSLKQRQVRRLRLTGAGLASPSTRLNNGVCGGVAVFA